MLALLGLMAYCALVDSTEALALGKRSEWPGFAGLETLFVFGDSYSRTGYEVTGVQPSVSSPLGNPTYPGDTSANGPNWVDYLTVRYNQSSILTYNFGTSGATLNTSIVAGDGYSVQDELNEQYLPYYATNGSWDSATSLFAIWDGINDVDGSYMGANVTNTTYVTIFEQYRTLIDTLYDSGARNFMLVTVIPLERTPTTTGFATAAIRIPLCAAAVENWNERLRSLQEDVQNAYSDVTVFYFDAHALFNAVIDDPAQFPQTASYQNTTGFCAAYASVKNETATSPDCAYPIDGYLWYNRLHPTSPMHDLLADKIAAFLSG